MIAIRGAPGVGKSAAAKRVAESFPGGARVEVDLLRKMVISVNWMRQEEHIQMLMAAAGFVHDLLEFNFRPVIVVDTFSGDKVNGFVRALLDRNSSRTVSVFALHASELVLHNRLRQRPQDEFRDLGISMQVNADVLRVRFEGEHLIDTSSLTPEQVADAIIHPRRP